MHIHQNMYGYWNAVWGAPATQADGFPGARWPRMDRGADGAPVTQNGPEDAASTRGGNPILQALAQALESVSSTSATATATPAASATAATTTTAPSSASATTHPAPAPNHEISSVERSIAGGVRHLLHALFEDVRAENLLAPGSGSASATGSSAPGASFVSGLAALISQVQSGSAPANLQRAFDALVANLNAVGTRPAAAPASDVADAAAATPAAAASTSTAAPAATLNTQALLVQFLANLQTDLGLGYGGSTGAPAQSATSGVMVNTAA